MKLKDKVAIITGANRGLGEAIAQAYAKEGAHLLLAARETALLQTSAGRVAEKLGPRSAEQKIEILATDISKLEDVTALANRALELFGRIDILVNNAGVYGPIGFFEEVDWQEWCDAININLFGTVAMTRAVVPIMKKQGSGKIINLSGGGATAPLPRFSSYAASKAAVVRLTETLAHELAPFNIEINAIAPGALNTRLLEQVIEAGPEQAGEDFYRRSLKQREEGGAPLEVGSNLAVFLASAESDGISGRLISAVWDDWKNFPQEVERLKKSDLFTLRRIVPEDRGWESKS
ncbi:MAG: SDR family oxidoreductase [Chloroflexi bacterium]|nr:SDR family oxidoreductase [Chloroflexota bacterium]